MPLQQITASAKIPVQYEQACQSLEACRTIDEAKYWSDKSEALAAWAKIFRSTKAATEARRLKLHAYRRMGLLAAELRPRTGRGSPGASSLLRENGFSQPQASIIRKVALTPQDTFDQLVALEKPPAPAWLRQKTPGYSEAWDMAFGRGSGPTLASLSTFCRKHDPTALAHGFKPDEARQARVRVRELVEWLDKFEQRLPSDGGK